MAQSILRFTSVYTEGEWRQGSLVGPPEPLNSACSEVTTVMYVTLLTQPPQGGRGEGGLFSVWQAVLAGQRWQTGHNHLPCWPCLIYSLVVCHTLLYTHVAETEEAAACACKEKEWLPLAPTPAAGAARVQRWPRRRNYILVKHQLWLNCNVGIFCVHMYMYVVSFIHPCMYMLVHMHTHTHSTYLSYNYT